MPGVRFCCRFNALGMRPLAEDRAVVKTSGHLLPRGRRVYKAHPCCDQCGAFRAFRDTKVPSAYNFE